MTRETKIGLLVGLAFIIVIGILLSDHLTSSTEPPPAPLAGAGSSVRSAVTTPAGPGNPPITTVAAPQGVAPQQTVPTRNELTAAQHGSPVQIDVGGPRNQTVPAPQVPETSPQEIPGDSTSVATNQPRESTPANPPDNNVNNAIRDAARQQGLEVVSVDHTNSQNTSSAPAPRTTQTNGNKYTAVDGDTVSKMATRFFGSNTKANREAIVAANPSLKTDPNRVIVGRSYAIPSNSGVVASATTTPPQTSSSTPSQSSAENWYTVKEGDSLWKIAAEQCGGPGAIPAIKELNKEALKGGETVIVNQKLKLPSKAQLASN